MLKCYYKHKVAVIQHSIKDGGSMIIKRKNQFFLLVILLIFITVACSKGANSEEQIETSIEENYYTFTDAMGVEVVLEKEPEIVVSLVGSYSETWVLAGGSLVGVTDDVEKEGRMEITNNMQVVGTIKEPNLEEILSLDPDFVLLTPDVDNQIKIAETLKQLNINHAFFKVEEFEDYLNMLNICTDITGKKELYEKNGLLVQKEIEDILSKVDNKDKEIKVLFIRAFSSGAKAKKDDNMTCTMLRNLGTVNIAAEHPSLLEELSIEEIIEEDPDFIFVTTMGNEQKALDGLKNGIEKNPAWNSLSAVKNDRYIILPKELFHYKPNAKWGESYRYLAEIIYPEIFN